MQHKISSLLLKRLLPSEQSCPW